MSESNLDSDPGQSRGPLKLRRLRGKQEDPLARAMPGPEVPGGDGEDDANFRPRPMAKAQADGVRGEGKSRPRA